MNKSQRVEDGLTSYKMPWEKPSTYKNAVTLKCIDCVNGPTSWDDLESTIPFKVARGINAEYRFDIKTCPSDSCPLHEFRPYRKKVEKM